MGTQQKALLVECGPEHTRGLDELNVQLNRGWKVIHLSPLGGAGSTEPSDYRLAALVVLERRQEHSAETVEAAEEETSELMRDIEESMGGSQALSEGDQNGGSQSEVPGE